MKNQVQLITYVDRLTGGGIAALHALLRGPLAGLFGGVHLLPFFDPIDGADTGFDPVDHTAVDARLGRWEDVSALAADVDLMADVIVNHLSSRSPQFVDFVARGAASEYAGLFLSFETVFPAGATQRDLLAIYRPRPGLPFVDVKLASGAHSILWSTFTAQQVDIDVRHPQGVAYLDRILDVFARNSIRMVRLDAVGYAIKQAGTSCFMLPETLTFIESFAARARGRSMEVLVEIHGHHRLQIEIAAHVDRVYDFALPPLVLHALFLGTAKALKHWLAIRPANALTVLDTHDGIGIIDIGAEIGADGVLMPGLVPPEELDRLVESIHANSHGQSRDATGAQASNLDLYQVNCTFYDALGRDDRAYLLARAVQFFVPGIPQVYYVGLLAGGNDVDLLARTGVGRDINRHHYAHNEVHDALERPIVRELAALIRFRNTHPAFAGQMQIHDTSDHVLSLEWRNGDHCAALHADFDARTFRIASATAAADIEQALADALQRLPRAVSPSDA